jgi:hypothetical protein
MLPFVDRVVFDAEADDPLAGIEHALLEIFRVLADEQKTRETLEILLQVRIRGRVLPLMGCSAGQQAFLDDADRAYAGPPPRPAAPARRCWRRHLHVRRRADQALDSSTPDERFRTDAERFITTWPCAGPEAGQRPAGWRVTIPWLWKAPGAQAGGASGWVPMGNSARGVSSSPNGPPGIDPPAQEAGGVKSRAPARSPRRAAEVAPMLAGQRQLKPPAHGEVVAGDDLGIRRQLVGPRPVTAGRQPR